MNCPNIDTFFFWLNTLSPHLVPALNCFARIGNCKVYVFVRTIHLPQRKILGWRTPLSSDLTVVENPDEFVISTFLASAPQRTMHIFGGVKGHGFGLRTVNAVIACGSSLSFIAERPDGRGIVGVLQKFRYRMLASRYGARASFFFAMGQKAVDWYGSVGFSKKSIYNYAYAVDELCPTEFRGDSKSRIVQLIFVGQIINRKGLDLLITALSLVLSAGVENWKLRIFGSGPDSDSILGLVAGLGLSGYVSFSPAVDNLAVRREIHDSDILILPSRFDGWGAVVNEALHSGTRVVCSDACGAAELVASSQAGGIFISESILDLRGCLVLEILAGRTSISERERIARWARCISPESIGRYLHEVLVFGRLNPPWIV